MGFSRKKCNKRGYVEDGSFLKNQEFLGLSRRFVPLEILDKANFTPGNRIE